MFFSVLSNEVVVVAHDGVDWNMMWTARLTQAAGMPTVKNTTSLAVGS
jgi:hypothetical protein